MKKQKKVKKNEQQTENKVVYGATGINTCIACGREIPEGQLVCMVCEVGTSAKHCMICDRPISEWESICSNCKDVLFRLKKKD